MDRRQGKTRKAILQAFDEILSEKSVDKITVTEIADLADIGKSTFYTHFETKEHLIQYICQDFFHHLKESEYSDRYPDLEQMLLHLLLHIYDEKNHILRLIKEENQICNHFFISYLDDVFVKYLHVDMEVNEVFARNHIVASFISALRWHINNPKILSLEKLVQDFIQLNGILL
ncbi:MAG: TetR/AcrR family transcriptional regulator [Eubacteriales bacterium]